MQQKIMALLHIAKDYTCLNTALTHRAYIWTFSGEVALLVTETSFSLPLCVSQHSLLIRECSFWFHDRFDNQGC